MIQRVFALTRPLGVALAVLILLNLVLALENPGLSLTGVWLDLHFPEPGRSIFATFLAAALLVPHDVGRAAWCRWILGGVIFGFWILVGADVVGYYHELHRGEFSTDLPVPLSLAVWMILLLEFARISWCRALEPKLPPPAWCFVHGIGLSVALFTLILIHIVTFGRTDFRRKADAAVVLGAKVYDDGSVCGALKDRLDTGIELYQQGNVSFLIMSGGVGKNGLSEPQVMAQYAFRNGGVPTSRIILDEEGGNTFESAFNCGRIARENGFRGLLTVSQYFHCARVKMIFKRFGAECYTVPTCSSQTSTGGVSRLSRESFFLFREVVAFPFYFLYYR